jgi:hypothetical protein
MKNSNIKCFISIYIISFGISVITIMTKTNNTNIIITNILAWAATIKVV